MNFQRDFESEHYVSSNMTWEDARTFVQYALGTFLVKFTTLVTIVSTMTAILAFAISDQIEQDVKFLLAGVCALILIFIITFIQVNGIRRLFAHKNYLIQTAQLAWHHAKTMEDEKDAILNSSDAHQESWARNSGLFGIALYKHLIYVQVLPNGGATVKFHLEFVATHPGINAIEQFSMATPPENLTDKSIELDANRKQVDGVVLTPEVIQNTHERLLWRLHGTPAFPTNRRLSYGYELKIPEQSMAMTQEELRERGEEWEYYFVRVSHPTQLLEIQINLPDGFRPTDDEPDVWFTSRIKVRHVKEYYRMINSQRLEGTWHRRSYQMKLTVHHPIQGLVYSLKWIPPVIWSSGD